jgi:hypothetical protein
MPDAAYMAAEANLRRNANTSRVLCAVIEIGWLTMTFDCTDIVESLATDADMNAMRMPLMVTSVVEAMSPSPMATRVADAATELALVISPAPNATRRAETVAADASTITPAPMATRCAAAVAVDCEDPAKPDAFTTSPEALTLDAAEKPTEAETTTAPMTDTVLVLVMSAAPRLTP